MKHNPDDSKHFWRVILLPEEMEWVKQKANERNKLSRDRGWVSKTGQTKSNQWDVAGLASELATALILNVPPPKITDDIHDLRDSDLHGNIEVKSSTYEDPKLWNLVVNEDQLKIERLYVLCLTMWLPKVYVVGWTTGVEIKNHARLTKHGASGHSIYVYPRQKLKDIKLLFDVIERGGEGFPKDFPPKVEVKEPQWSQPQQPWIPPEQTKISQQESLPKFKPFR